MARQFANTEIHEMAKDTRTINRLKAGKVEREAFVVSEIRVSIPFQVRALRAQRGWDQKTLAEKSGMAQPRISAIEKIGGANLNLETLKRLAAAFDIGLVVKFAPFSELVAWSDNFSPDNFAVASFDEDSFSDEATSSTIGTESSISTVAPQIPPRLRGDAVNSTFQPISAGSRTTNRIRTISDSAFGIQHYGT